MLSKPTKIKRHICVVGYGLAGCMVAHHLLKRGASITVFNYYNEHSASQVAAGIINPITGKNFIKSWRIDQLLPYALDTYREIETLTNQRIITSRNIIRALKNTEEINNWALRTADAHYQNYIPKNPNSFAQAEHFRNSFGVAEISNAHRVDIKNMLSGYLEIINREQTLINTYFEPSNVVFQNDKVRYEELEFDEIIFTDGVDIIKNPLFTTRVMKPTLGEACIVKIPNMNLQAMYKDDLFFVPLANDEYWVGGGYDLKYSHDEATRQSMLIDKINSILKLPHITQSYTYALRPTTIDRRPIFLQSNLNPRVFSFNGLGTKGASLAPYFSKIAVDYILDSYQKLEIPNFSI